MTAIRPPRADEYDAIGEIFHEAVRQLAARDYTADQLRAWSGAPLPAGHWRQRTAALEVRVALVENAPAGFIGFSRTGHIDLLFTHPTFARSGFARAMLTSAEAELCRLDVATAWTEASQTARGFFLAMGYRATREQTVVCNGVELRNCRMEKDLARTAASSGARPRDAKSQNVRLPPGNS